MTRIILAFLIFQSAVLYFSTVKIAHNSKVVSSSLTPATKEYITRTVTVLVIFYCIGKIEDFVYTTKKE